MDWPSTPNAEHQSPSLMQLMGSQGPESLQASYLAIATAEIAKQGWKLDSFQVASSSGPTWFTIPCLAVKGEQPYLIFTHYGSWSNDDMQRFLRWNASVRGSPQTGPYPILVIHTDDPGTLKTTVSERHGVFFLSVPWERNGQQLTSAPQQPNAIFILVDDRKAGMEQDWLAAANAAFLTLPKPIGNVDISAVPPFVARVSKRYDPDRLKINPDDYQYFPKVLDVEYPASADLQARLNIASNILMAVEQVGCKCRIVVVKGS